VNIRPMTADDYAAVMALMSGTPGIAVRAADSPEAVARYLARNPGLSLVAEGDDGLVGCVFCGHDGRRGYLHHVVVAPDHRGAWRRASAGGAGARWAGGAGHP
jgi:ribosomal protein S18 acetylase RimI-like enzyme